MRASSLLGRRLFRTAQSTDVVSRCVAVRGRSHHHPVDSTCQYHIARSSQQGFLHITQKRSSSSKPSLNTAKQYLQSVNAHEPVARNRRLSSLWTPTWSTRKEAPSTSPPDTHNLLIRAGFIRQTHAGIFQTLPLGQRVQTKIERLLDYYMGTLNASKLSLSSFSHEDLWRQSGRLTDDNARAELFKLQDRRGSKFLLSPTHEEEITALFASNVGSYRDLPLRVYQIGRKYRDELRARQGLLRAREFLMKDLYTFDADRSQALETYEAVRLAYVEFFEHLGLYVYVAQADSGSIGGDVSHEYHLLSPSGEDTLLICEDCKLVANVETLNGGVSSEAKDATSAEAQEHTPRLCPQCSSSNTSAHTSIELAHTFYLGTKYSAPLNAHITTASNESVPVEMGCHGIGITRLIAAAAAEYSDARGLGWPRAIAPFEAVVIANADFMADAETMRLGLQAANIDAVLDDRDKGLAWKLKDADLIGYPVIVVLGRAWKEGKVEVQCRRLGLKEEIALESLRETVTRLLESCDAVDTVGS